MSSKKPDAQLDDDVKNLKTELMECMQLKTDCLRARLRNLMSSQQFAFITKHDQVREQFEGVIKRLHQRNSVQDQAEQRYLWSLIYALDEYRKSVDPNVTRTYARPDNTDPELDNLVLGGSRHTTYQDHYSTYGEFQ